MARWADLAAAEPDVAAAGETMFGEFSLAFLGTTGEDGWARIHPITITVESGDLWAFLVHGTPKREDLTRDGRYALHSFPRFPGGTVDSYVDEELFLRGRATPVDDPAVRERVAEVHNDTIHERDRLFRLELEYAQHKTRRDGRALYTRWRAT